MQIQAQMIICLDWVLSQLMLVQWKVYVFTFNVGTLNNYPSHPYFLTYSNYPLATGPAIKEVFNKDYYNRYPLLDALYKAGYTYNGLRRLLIGPGGKGALSQAYVRELLTERTHDLTLSQLITIAGLLGCPVLDVLLIIGQGSLKDIRTAEALRNGKLRHPDKRLDKRIFSHQLKNEDIPAPDWLGSIDGP